MKTNILVAETHVFRNFWLEAHELDYTIFLRSFSDYPLVSEIVIMYVTPRFVVRPLKQEKVTLK